MSSDRCPALEGVHSLSRDDQEEEDFDEPKSRPRCFSPVSSESDGEVPPPPPNDVEHSDCSYSSPFSTINGEKSWSCVNSIQSFRHQSDGIYPPPLDDFESTSCSHSSGGDYGEKPHSNISSFKIRRDSSFNDQSARNRSHYGSNNTPSHCRDNVCTGNGGSTQQYIHGDSSFEVRKTRDFGSYVDLTVEDRKSDASSEPRLDSPAMSSNPLQVSPVGLRQTRYAGEFNVDDEKCDTTSEPRFDFPFLSSSSSSQRPSDHNKYAKQPDPPERISKLDTNASYHRFKIPAHGVGKAIVLQSCDHWKHGRNYDNTVCDLSRHDQAFQSITCVFHQALMRKSMILWQNAVLEKIRREKYFLVVLFNRWRLHTIDTIANREQRYTALVFWAAAKMTRAFRALKLHANQSKEMKARAKTMESFRISYQSPDASAVWGCTSNVERGVSVTNMTKRNNCYPGHHTFTYRKGLCVQPSSFRSPFFQHSNLSSSVRRFSPPEQRNAAKFSHGASYPSGDRGPFPVYRTPAFNVGSMGPSSFHQTQAFKKCSLYNRNFQNRIQDIRPVSNQHISNHPKPFQEKSCASRTDHVSARLDLASTMKFRAPFSNVRSIKNFYEERFVVAYVLDGIVSKIEER